VRISGKSRVGGASERVGKPTRHSVMFDLHALGNDHTAFTKIAVLAERLEVLWRRLSTICHGENMVGVKFDV
jgi:hypothetical protein